MIAPTSDDRISMIAKDAAGFLYIVSSMGVTGVRSQINTDLDAMVERVRASSNVPCAIGFGISTPEQAKKMAGIADGAIVGSAIVKIIAQHGKECVDPVADYVATMKAAVKAAE